MNKIQEIQTILGVKPDGIFGPKSRAALEDIISSESEVHRGLASSFADPKDISEFKKWKARYIADGFSEKIAEKKAFAKGDNGIGLWGDSTAPGSGNAAALTTEDIIARWGSLERGRGKPILVTNNGTQATVILKDIKGHMNDAIIDLNSDACDALGIKIPAMHPVEWEWV